MLNIATSAREATPGRAAAKFCILCTVQYMYSRTSACMLRSPSCNDVVKAYLPQCDTLGCLNLSGLYVLSCMQQA